MFRLSSVCKARGKLEVLQGVSGEIGPAEVVGIVGPNGAGKSTLIEIASGVLQPDRGTVAICERNIHSDYRVKALVTTVFQHTLFEPTITPLDALMFHARVLGIRNPRPKIEEAMSLLRVDNYQSKRILELSGGTRKKVELAKIFIHETPVILLDEPTNGLDQESREVVWQRIRALAGNGSSVAIISHDKRETFSLADTVWELNGGIIRPYRRRPLDLDQDTLSAKLEITFESWTSGELSNLQSLPGVLHVTVKKHKSDPTKMVEDLRTKGAIPKSGSVQVIYLDKADDLLKSLGIDPSQAVQVPKPDLPGPAEVEIRMENVDVNLPGLMKWAVDRGLQITNVKIDRDGIQERTDGEEVCET